MNYLMIKLVLYGLFIGWPMLVGKVALEELVQRLKRRKK